MNYKRTAASGLTGGLQGAGAGAAIGSVVPGLGTALGAGIGGGLGVLGGILSNSADDEEMRNDPEYQAAKRREKAMKMMSASLGRAFGAMRPTTMQGAMTRGI